MPLNPNIILGAQPVQVQNPFEALQTVAQLQGLREQSEARRLAADEARQKAKDAAAVRQILTESGGDMELALPKLRTVVPKLALEMETEIQQARKEKFDAATHQMTARTKGLEFASGLAALVAQNPALAPAVRDHLQGLSAEITPLLPQTDDPAAWEQFSQVTLTAKDRYAQSQDRLKLFAEGKVQEALGGALSTATNAEEWDAHIKGFLDLGGPKTIAAAFGAYSPENVTRAAQLAITPSKRAELAGQAAGRAQTAAHQAVLEDQGAARVAIARQRAAQGGTEPLVQVMENGVPVWRTRAQAVGQPAGGGTTGRPATGVERGALAFYNRALQGVETLTTPDATGTTLEDRVSGASVSWLPNMLQSADTQSYTQAQRAFTEARLRKESGAAISPQEYENDCRIYFKQPGDSPAVIEQKRLAREKVLNGLAFSAGKAYEEYYGEPFTRETGTTAPPIDAANRLDPLTVTTPDGQMFRFKTAAEAAAFKRRAGIPDGPTAHRLREVSPRTRRRSSDAGGNRGA